MRIKILGTGCPECIKLEKSVLDALAEMKLVADVQKEEDIHKIMSYGIPSTPGLVINGKMILSGRVPSMKEIKEILEQNK